MGDGRQTDRRTDKQEKAEISCGTSHVSAASTYTTSVDIQKRAMKKASHSCGITCERSESARDRRIALYKSDQPTKQPLWTLSNAKSTNQPTNQQKPSTHAWRCCIRSFSKGSSVIVTALPLGERAETFFVYKCGLNKPKPAAEAL